MGDVHLAVNSANVFHASILLIDCGFLKQANCIFKLKKEVYRRNGPFVSVLQHLRMKSWSLIRFMNSHLLSFSIYQEFSFSSLTSKLLQYLLFYALTIRAHGIRMPTLLCLNFINLKQREGTKNSKYLLYRPV